MTDDVVPPSYDAAVPGAVILDDFIQTQRHAMRFKARAWSSVHCGAVSVARALGRDVAGGLRIDRCGALVTQTQSLRARGAAHALLLNRRRTKCHRF